MNNEPSNNSNMEKQLTALQQSIARKKTRLQELIEGAIKCNLDSPAQKRYDVRISDLQYEITEDEKLLAVERNNIELAFDFGWNHHRSGLSTDSEEYYNDTFKND
jgi:hypothetical protein